SSIIDGESSRPVICASDHRSASTFVLFPGPHPRSIAFQTCGKETRATRSRHGCVRSSSNFRYWSAFQVGISSSVMIIDCHGHYTTAPKELQAYRDTQIAGLKDPAHVPSKGNLKITDDQIRESLEGAQLKLQRERGTDVTIFSPRASAMAHHIGDATVSLHWAEHCNDLIHRVCTLYPENFVGVCQLPQSPGVPPGNCIGELQRCVKELGLIGCNLNPAPSGGHWTAPPLTDRYWYPFYEKMVELVVQSMVYFISSYNVHFHAISYIELN